MIQDSFVAAVNLINYRSFFGFVSEMALCGKQGYFAQPRSVVGGKIVLFLKCRATIFYIPGQVSGQVLFTVGDITQELHSLEMLTIGPSVEHAIEAIEKEHRSVGLDT